MVLFGSCLFGWFCGGVGCGGSLLGWLGKLGCLCLDCEVRGGDGVVLEEFGGGCEEVVFELWDLLCGDEWCGDGFVLWGDCGCLWGEGEEWVGVVVVGWWFEGCGCWVCDLFLV